MPNFEKALLEIRRHLSLWANEVGLANAVGYFNINKISEGTALMLLNLVFDIELKDLNREQNNYPGIDLGDKKNGKLAFQVTSQTDNRKLLSSLETFVSENHKKSYPNGIRFFIIGKRSKSRRNNDKFSAYRDIFDPKEHIYYLDDLLMLIEQIYYQDEDRFNKIEDLLKREFASSKPDPQKRSVVEFNSPAEKFTFYKRILSGIYHDTGNIFVHFYCRLDDGEVSTDDLNKIILESDGLVVLGPSGCGKSMLSRMLAMRFLEHGFALVLESKYYETDLNDLLEKSIVAFGFDSMDELFQTSKKLDIAALVIIDGINECEGSKRPKLLLEIEKLKTDHQVKIVLSGQQNDPLIGPLNLTQINVDHPSLETKKSIANKFSGKGSNDKLQPLLNTISTSLEAKMVGEIAIENIERISRFTLFEVFVRQKLGAEKSDGFLLLSHIARILSEDISFSLPERRVEEILRANAIPSYVYERCIEGRILESTMGKTSFSHEMFFSFFVAESIIRFYPDTQSILSHINAPKNHDKRLLIIGSIEDTIILNEVLDRIRDVHLLNALCQGDGGEYSKKWTERKLAEIMKMVANEIDQVQYEITPDEMYGIGIINQSLINWTDQQRTFIDLIPYRLVRGEYLSEIFDFIGKMDIKIGESVKALKEDLQKLEISAAHGAFVAAYARHSQTKTAIGSIVSSFESGIITFDYKLNIPDEKIEELAGGKSLSAGKFYFIVTMLRWNEKLQRFYIYALDLIKNKWRGTPTTLLYEVLNTIHYFPRNETEKKELIEGLNIIHSETKSAWTSTSIFDALSLLGALEEDADRYVPIVEEQIGKLLHHPDSAEKCDEINGIYNSQFDHPYSNAYQDAISNLSRENKELFYQMAIKGLHSVFFGVPLLLDSFYLLKEKICPLITRFAEIPITEKSFPQDAFRVFLLSHVILGKFNHPLVSRFEDTEDPIERSLYAAAELYYWNNRKDLNSQQIKTAAASASGALFAPSNSYAIDTLDQCERNLHQISFRRLFTGDPVIYVCERYGEQIVNQSMNCLKNLDSQKPIKNLSYEDDPNLHALYLLGEYGSPMAIELLKSLSEHPKYGKEAVNAIKEISQK